MKYLRQTNLYLLLLMAVAIGRPATAQYTVGGANPSFTTIWNVASGDWTTGSNWIAGEGGVGGVPDIDQQDFGLINNGGTANVMTNVASPIAGGVILGTEAGDSGTLDIQSGGVLNVQDDPPGPPDFTADGSVQVGRNGTGQLFVRRGGTLNSMSLSLGGQVGSTITLGGTTGSVNAMVNTGAVTLGRTTRVIGPNVTFNSMGTGAGITFQGTSVFIPELTGPTHSVLTTTGNAAVNGTLQVDINGASTATGSSWLLLDAANITGAFTSIVGDSAAPLGLGQVYRFDVADGGNGKQGRLVVGQQFVLNVNRNTGAVSISNPANSGSAGLATDGYTVQSTAGAINMGNWQSLQTSGVAGAGWEVANPTANRVSELRSSGTSTLAVDSNWGLGNLFQPPAPAQFGQVVEDLVFQYNDPVTQQTVDGVVNYTGSANINNLVLLVDPTTGNVKIRNTSPFNVAIDGYTISSAGGSLNSTPSLWTSLQDQPGVAGAGWAESNLNDTRVSELKSSAGATTLNSDGGTTFDLGSLFETGSAKDLVFEFLLDGNSEPNTGVVVYESGTACIAGDFNCGGAVENADLTLLLNNWAKAVPPVPAGWIGSPQPTGPAIDNDELTALLNNWGQTAGGGSVAVAGQAVPEPATLGLLVLASYILAASRRVKRQRDV